MRNKHGRNMPDRFEYDIIVIGAGVTGAAIARELSRYTADVAVLESEEDVCSGTSKANSGIVHAGYDAMPGTLKARFNVRGAALIRELSKTLDFDFKENGSMVVSFEKEGRSTLEELRQRGITNGVEGLSIISGEEARKLEPALSEEIDSALLVEHGGIVCPFLMNVAFAENAAENGVDFHFLTRVKDIRKDDSGFRVLTEKTADGGETSEKEYKAKIVINAAGVYADVIHNLVSEKKLEIIPRRGEYVLMDRAAGGMVGHTIFQLPTKLGKGVLVTPTVHGNLMVGPNAVNLDDKEAVEVTADGLDEIKSKALRSIPKLPYNKTITSFAGLRAHEKGYDFVVGEAEDVPGFFDAAGIESPGLTSAPAIGEYIAGLVAGKLELAEKTDFKAERKGFVKMKELSVEERNHLIADRPEYGKIVCRCEEITEGEILDAIRRPVGAVSLDGIKRRVRQGMGRCQAGFCTPRTIQLLAEELGIPEEAVCKNRPGSELLVNEEGASFAEESASFFEEGGAL